MAPPPLPDTTTGFLTQGDDGHLRFGVDSLRGWPWRLDGEGIAEEVPEAELARGLVTPKAYRWEELRQVSLRLRPTIALGLLFQPLRDFEYRLEVRTGERKGWFMFQHHLLARTDSRIHARALPALMQYIVATPPVRKRLDDEASVARLVDGVRDCLAGTEMPAPPKARWPDAPYQARRELDAAAVAVLGERGVIVFGGRPVVGGRLDATPEVIDAVRADFAAHTKALPPPDDAIVAAIDAMQGPRPDWPFDVLGAP